MVEAKQIIGFVTFGFSCLSVIFAILALALADWVVAGTLSESAGLWQGCIADICFTIPASAVQGFVHAVRAMVLLGLFAMVGATAMTGVHVFCAKDNRLVMYASICLAAVAGLFLMIGFAIFADKSPMSQDMTVATFGPGFALCTVAWLSAWVVAILNGIVVFAGRTTNTNSKI